MQNRRLAFKCLQSKGVDLSSEAIHLLTHIRPSGLDNKVTFIFLES